MVIMESTDLFHSAALTLMGVQFSRGISRHCREKKGFKKGLKVGKSASLSWSKVKRSSAVGCHLNEILFSHDSFWFLIEKG